MKILFTIAFLFICSTAWATTYYVRDGGGSVYGTSNGTNTCNGLYNVVYSSGVSPNCAMNGPGWIVGVNGDRGTNAALWASGDTLYIDGDSDTTPGAQAQYMVGYGMPGSAGYVCDPNSTYTCVLLAIPAGTSGSPTSIIGTGTHKPQLWGIDRTYQVINANNNYITLQWLELTDHESCAYNDPTEGCSGSPAYDDGLTISGTGITLTDIYVHGFSRYGINTGQMGSATFTRVWAIGNGFGGITVGNAGTQSVTGTLTFNQPIVEWNGCVEAYPMTNSGIDNPSNYTNCFGQTSGGYGDGLAFGSTGNQNAGNWTVIGPGSISFNTQDGFDVLHGNGNGTIQIDKMRFEGNAGQQVKSNSVNFYLTNNLIIGDCGWWWTAPQSLSGAMGYGSDACRAGGDVVLFNVTNNSTIAIYNNTLLSNGGIALESKDEESTGCNQSGGSGTQIHAYNNIVLGGYVWDDDTAFNSAGGNAVTTYLYNDGNDGNGAGTCGNLTWDENYNNVSGTKNSNSGCVGANDKCGTSPGFTGGTIPMGHGSAGSYYQGQSAITLVPISSGSAAKGAGVTGLTYWNTGTDYYNVTRASPPSIGGLEYASCAVNTFAPCFFNSDCCTGACTNNACSGSPNNGSMAGSSLLGGSNTF